MKHLRGNLSYSNVMVTILAVLVVGGGTAYAASQMLPKNSVGSKQIKKGAVTPAKLSEAAKSTLTGPQGPPGPKGDTGAKGDTGQRGEKGDLGEPGPFPSTLPSGKSLSGYMTIFDEGSKIETNSAAFAFPLAGAPTPHYVKVAAPTPAGCEGTSANPGADPGNLCVFAITETNIEIANVNGPGGDSTTDTRGFAVFLRPTVVASFAQVKLLWVVTG